MIVCAKHFSMIYKYYCKIETNGITRIFIEKENQRKEINYYIVLGTTIALNLKVFSKNKFTQ